MGLSVCVLLCARVRHASASGPGAGSLKQRTPHNQILAAISTATSIPPRTKVNNLLNKPNKHLQQTVTLSGWVKTVRKQKTQAFLNLNDGSNLKGMQVVLLETVPDFPIVEQLSTGAAITVQGTVVESPAKGQDIELMASSIRVVGDCPSDSYPLQKKRHSLEFLRSIAHLRPRTNTIGAVARVRSALSVATHDFFRSQGFHYVHTPLITSSDCEGAGEMFRVTTLPPSDDTTLPSSQSASSVEQLEADVALAGESVREKKGAGASKDEIDAAVDLLLTLKAKLASLKSADQPGSLANDFFGKAAYLTVSGQLSAEAYACALGDVYTFGPTFRAEDSNTARHLAEFWMIEPEMAFADLEADMDNAEKFVKHVVQYALETCQDDIEFFAKFNDPGLIDKLQGIVDKDFARIRYSDAVNMLRDEIAKDPTLWEYPEVMFGTDLATEHERWLAERAFGRAVFVYDYPREIKAFYMRDNDDGKTVAAMDLLVPGVGELIGGSQREERLEVLLAKMKELGLQQEDYSWYLDLRRFGSVPHAGYGLGFERLVCYVTGVSNIRDAIPFPRYPGSCEF